MDVIGWLLDGDPAIRWQAMRDLTDADPGAVAAERVRVAQEGLGAQILARQGSDGAWHLAGEPDWIPTLGGGSFNFSDGLEYMAAFDPTTAARVAFSPSTGPSVRTLLPLGSDLYVGGSFGGLPWTTGGFAALSP